MKANNQPLGGPQQNTPDTKSNQDATNPKKPNNDPDQTPNREVENVPVAKPGEQATEKNRIGFHK